MISRRLRDACRVLTLFLVGVTCTAAALGAQALRVTSTSGLAFGTLSPLVMKTITPADPLAAVFTIQGPASSTIAVLVVTPDQLMGTGQFVTTSNWTATVTTQFGTSPSALALVAGNELSVTLGTDGLATIRVGSSIRPPVTVGSGSFSGALTVVARQASAGLMSLTAQGSVTATVRQPLIFTAAPMEFGVVYVSTPKTLAPTDARSLRILIDGALGATVEVTLESVPTSLTRDGGGGTLPIGTWLSRAGGANCSGAQSTPTVGAPIALDLLAAAGSLGRTSFCLGGTVTPAALQAPGSYSGVVVVSVRYTGA